MGNSILNSAKTAKKDEFYTQISDIENELRHYKAHFRGKTVLCNCDDPRVSNFFKYFALKFKELGIKKLIATCYKNQDFDLFSNNDCEQAAYLVYEGTPEIDHIPDISEIQVNYLKGDGDFRSKECIELLKQADIVCTNPPFSLFREYVMQLIKYKKQFLILGRTSALHYSEIFPLIQEGKMWVGHCFNVTMIYETPYKNVKESNRKLVKAKGFDPDKCIAVPAITWYTNLDFPERHEEVILYKKYKEGDYPHYYNFNAIDVGNISDIPCDYEGMMGVPDTLLGRFNQEQFELIGLGRDGEGITVDRSIYPKIKKLNPNSRPSHIGFYTEDGMAKEPYSRIIVKLKHPKK